MFGVEFADESSAHTFHKRVVHREQVEQKHQRYAGGGTASNLFSSITSSEKMRDRRDKIAGFFGSARGKKKERARVDKMEISAPTGFR
jgi:hypothetical protein